MRAWRSTTWRCASTRYCRRRSARAAASRAAARMPKRWPAGRSQINRCPPGGDAVIAELAALTARAPLPLDPACGAHAPLEVAVIDEAACIGCTLCIEACPVDAIIGAQKRMHAILPSLCSGCAAVRAAMPGRLHHDGARGPAVDRRRCRGRAQPARAPRVAPGAARAHRATPARRRCGARAETGRRGCRAGACAGAPRQHVRPAVMPHAQPVRVPTGGAR